MLGWRFRSRRISMKPLRTRRYGTGKGYAVTHAKGIGHVVHRRSSHRGALALTLCRGGKLRDLGPALLNQGSGAFD
jgi:hypothetical protein